ncbi:hypothetical protein [Natrinema amylolyticum]|nr:hypothetical protein [Natrinema amylolyticum]
MGLSPRPQGSGRSAFHRTSGLSRNAPLEATDGDAENAAGPTGPVI